MMAWKLIGWLEIVKALKTEVPPRRIELEGWDGCGALVGIGVAGAYACRWFWS